MGCGQSPTVQQSCRESEHVEISWLKLFELTSISAFCLYNACNGYVNRAAEVTYWTFVHSESVPVETNETKYTKIPAL
jgi:hypothetical protein